MLITYLLIIFFIVFDSDNVFYYNIIIFICIYFLENLNSIDGNINNLLPSMDNP